MFRVTFTTKKVICGSESHEHRRNDHQLKQLLIVKQILLVGTLGNV